MRRHRITYIFVWLTLILVSGACASSSPYEQRCGTEVSHKRFKLQLNGTSSLRTCKLDSGATSCEVALQPATLTGYMLLRERYRSILRSLHWKAVLKYGRDALTALDVGAYDPFALTQLTWVPTKLALDIQFSPKQSPVWASTPGIVFLNSDIFKTKFVGRRFDLVMSSQVVEHIPPSMVKKFVKRMMSLAKTLIVSTTYELPFGTIPGHVNDPISTKAFLSWFDHPDEPGQIVHYEHCCDDDGSPNVIRLRNKLTNKKVLPMNQVAVWRSSRVQI